MAAIQKPGGVAWKLQLVGEKELGEVAETIDSENISAEMKDGVLHVTVTKLPAAQPRKVEIK